MLTREGPTPAGGVRSEAYLTDAAGRPTDDPAAAVAAEIVEYDAAGDVIRRTHGRTDLTPVSAPSGLGDEDTDAFQGGTWDVTVSVDGRVKPVETLDELRTVLDADALGPSFRPVLASLTVMPAWANAPARLRDEAHAWLEAGRPQ